MKIKKFCLPVGIVFIFFAHNHQVWSDDPHGCAAYRSGPKRTGCYNSKPVRKSPKLKWKFKTRLGLNSAPVISGDTVFFGSRDQHFYAVDRKNGKLRWKFKKKYGEYTPSPTVLGNTVFCANSSGEFYALNCKDGSIVWSRENASSCATTPLVAGGIVFYGTLVRKKFSDPVQAYLFAVVADSGEEVWKRKLWEGGGISQPFSGTPAFADGILYFAEKKTLYALDAKTGEEKWQHKLENGSIVGPPAVGKGFLVFAQSTFPARMHVLDLKTRKSRVIFEKGNSNSIKPPALDGSVVYISSGHVISAVKVKTGKELWSFKTKRFTNTPSVAKNTVYVGSGDKHMYALDKKKGRLLWKFKTADWVSCPPVVHDGVVYFGCNKGFLYAVKGK